MKKKWKINWPQLVQCVAKRKQVSRAKYPNPMDHATEFAIFIKEKLLKSSRKWFFFIRKKKESSAKKNFVKFHANELEKF